jgi:hypothetical protein
VGGYRTINLQIVNLIFTLGKIAGRRDRWGEVTGSSWEVSVVTKGRRTTF